MAAAPPAPRSILRGHKAQVHAAEFLRANERLATGDAEGHVVLWDLTILRPRAVWRAHEGAILGIRAWGRDRLITHGRDHRLIVWKVGEDDEERLSTALPLEDVAVPRPQPWVVYLLPVNTMNFCSFSACPGTPTGSLATLDEAAEVLLAVPNTLASEAIDIYSLPSQSRIHTVQSGQQGGMAMDLSLFHHQGHLCLIAAFEDGSVSVHVREADSSWVATYRSQPHSQPILSLDVHPSREYFLTSAADSIIAKHPIPVTRQEVPAAFDPRKRVIEEIDVEAKSSPSAAPENDTKAPQPAKTTTLKAWEHPLKTINTKHSGQQSLRLRSDGKIFATAGWDSNVRVYSSKTLKELAVLQWHKVGCYAVAFADVTAADTASGSAPDQAQDTGAAEGPAPPRSTAVVQAHGMSVKDRRMAQAKTTHWVVAGSKDGKVSLWSIY
jgi:WD40 repeat protein